MLQSWLKRYYLTYNTKIFTKCFILAKELWAAKKLLFAIAAIKPKTITEKKTHEHQPI